MIDLRDPRDPQPAGDLAVLSPDLTTVVHTSRDFGARHGILGPVAGRLVAEVFGRHFDPDMIGPDCRGPDCSGPDSGARGFAYETTALDGTELTFDARVVVPFGDGRPVVVEVWPRAEPASGPGARRPHPELAPALADLEHESGIAAALDTYLHCLRYAAAAAGVAVIRTDAGVAHVVAAAGDTGLVAGRSYPATFVLAELPVVLAAARPDDDLTIVARPGAAAGATGWLGGAAQRAARSLQGPSSRTAARARPYEASDPTKVVYLDDDPGSLELLVEYFRLLPSLELVPVRNEREAHDAIAEHRPAVVLVDAWLGDRSAEGLVREILAGSQLEVPAVVILSADANASTVARFRRLGITSYLSKPIDLGHLFTVVDALARDDEREEGNESNARTIATSGN